MYSPKISEELVPALYWIAKEEKKPMTRLVNDIIKSAIERRYQHERQGNIEHGVKEI